MGETTGECQVWTHGFPVPGRTAELARQAEESGFGGLLLADSPNLVGDPFVELGVARGDSSLAQIGLAAPPLARLRDLVAQVRGYLRGEEVKAGGTASRIGWIAETGLPAV